MKNIGIINIGNSEKVYFLLESIRKNCQYDKIILIETNFKDPIMNHIDDVEKVILDDYEIYKENILKSKSIQKLIDLSDDELIIIDPTCLVKRNEDIWSLNKDIIYGNEKILFIDCKRFKEKGMKWYNKNITQFIGETIMNIQNDDIVNNVIWNTEDISYIDWLYKNQTNWKRDYYDTIISLTTWKGRIKNDATMEVLRSLLNQNTKYKYKVVLVLSEEEFKNRIIPRDIELLQSDMFEILWTYKDTRPLKKLDPTMEKYPLVPIISLDDDDLCYDDMVEFIINEHRKDPWSVLGTMIEYNISYCKWVAGVRLFPPNCLYKFPLSDYYDFYDGILDDNFNAMRCLYKMTPVKGISDEHNMKRNDNDLKLTYEYSNTNWNEYYRRFIRAHIKELPKELYYE